MKTNRIIGLMLTLNFLFLASMAEAQGYPWVDTVYSVKFTGSLKYNDNQEKLKLAVSNSFLARGDSAVRVSSVDKVTFFNTVHIKGLGRVVLFKVHYADQLAWAYDRDQVLIADNSRHHLFLVSMDKIDLLKVSASDKDFYFAGVYERRGYGKFRVYHWSKGALRVKFISPDDVGNYSNDCISYKNEFLQFENVDLNNDGCLDLHFFGVANYYCKSVENLGRYDIKPLRSKKIAFTYYFDAEKNTWYAAKVKKKSAG